MHKQWLLKRPVFAISTGRQMPGILPDPTGTTNTRYLPDPFPHCALVLHNIQVKNIKILLTINISFTS